MYQGLKKNRIYWEFVNVLRKVFILLINAFIPSDMWFMRILVAITFMIVFLRAQGYLRPYKKDLHTELEQREIYSAIITLYCGLYFNSGSLSAIADGAVLLFLSLVNYMFFTKLLFCFMRIPNVKYVWYYKIVRVVRILAFVSSKYSVNILNDDLPEISEDKKKFK